MNAADNLMLRGIAGPCPDCGDERILIQVDLGEYCCTDCDAYVVLLDVSPGHALLVGRLAS